MVGKSKIKEKSVVEQAIRFLHEPQGSNVRSITNYATNVLGIPLCRAGSMIFYELQNGVENGIISKDRSRYAMSGKRRQRTIGSHRHTRQEHNRGRPHCCSIVTNVKKPTRTPKSVRKKSDRMKLIKSKTRTRHDVKRGVRSRKVRKESSSKVTNRNEPAVQSTSSGTVKVEKRTGKTRTRAPREADSNTSLESSSPESSSTEMEQTLAQPSRMNTTRKELTGEDAAADGWRKANDRMRVTPSEDSLGHSKTKIEVTTNTDSEVNTSIMDDGNNGEDNPKSPSEDSLNDEQLLDDSLKQDSINNRMADQ